MSILKTKRKVDENQESCGRYLGALALWQAITTETTPNTTGNARNQMCGGPLVYKRLIMARLREHTGAFVLLLLIRTSILL